MKYIHAGYPKGAIAFSKNGADCAFQSGTVESDRAEKVQTNCLTPLRSPKPP